MSIAGMVSGGLAALFLLLAAHPFVFYPVSLALLRRIRRRPVRAVSGAGEALSFAVCVAAYNEEAVIEEKVRNLLEMRRAAGELEILVYVDGAGDRTAEILERHAGEITVVAAPHRRGKTHGMNGLVSMARADIVLFTDANVMVDPQAIPNLRKYFADPEVGCVCGFLTYVNDKETATAASGSLYWRLEETIKQLESDTGSVIGADGSIFAMRRSLHRPVPEDIIDDFFHALNILCEGSRIVRAPDARAYEKAVTAPREEFRRKVRIACQALNVHRLMWPRLRRLDALSVYKYLSHKWLRWMEIYLLAASGLAAAAAVAFIFGPMAAAAAVLLVAGAGALAAGSGNRWAAFGIDVLTAFLATGIGVLRSYRGDRFQTWTPADSIRRTP